MSNETHCEYTVHLTVGKLGISCKLAMGITLMNSELHKGSSVGPIIMYHTMCSMGLPHNVNYRPHSGELWALPGCAVDATVTEWQSHNR